MSAPADPTRLPCPCCHGRRFYLVPQWESPTYSQVPRPITVAARVRAADWVISEGDVLRVPLLLRVCVSCGAAQPFANPAAVHALTTTQPPAAFYIDATEDPGAYR
jgi:hypothetical protein